MTERSGYLIRRNLAVGRCITHVECTWCDVWNGRGIISTSYQLVMRQTSGCGKQTLLRSLVQWVLHPDLRIVLLGRQPVVVGESPKPVVCWSSRSYGLCQEQWHSAWLGLELWIFFLSGAKRFSNWAIRLSHSSISIGSQQAPVQNFSAVDRDGPIVMIICWNSDLIGYRSTHEWRTH